ncbi:MAG TPA: FAD-dependent monooxygenase [Ktedonobacterales bacterium]
MRPKYSILPQQHKPPAFPATIIYKPLQTSTPVKQWQTKHITLVGDAIHSMPPTQGSGGNTALHDAQLLVEQLAAASDGKKPLLQVIHDYESVMIREGFALVRRSQQALDLHIAKSRLMTTLLLRSMNIVMSLPRPGKNSAAQPRSGTTLAAPQSA